MMNVTGIRKPRLEKVSNEFGSSISVKYYDIPSPQENPPFWHFHPEIELVYVNGGKGKRHIGNHMSYYQSGDLVLIGSMLPHAGFTDRLTRNKSETIIQFQEDCFGPEFFKSSEMKDIQNLFERAKSGLVFHGDDKDSIGSRMEKLVQLDNFARVIELLCILQDMAWSNDYEILNADGYAIEVDQTDNDRFSVIYSFVQQHFKRPIPLEEIAGIANMTVPSFCRYFKRISGKKFTRFVNEIRIVHACKLLTEESDSITNVSFESGFNNASHFNRLFKEITQKSPTEYRKQFLKIVQK